MTAETEQAHAHSPIPASWQHLPEQAREKWDALLRHITIPPLAFEMASLKPDSDQADAKVLARKVAMDPLLAAKVLVVANSASSGRSVPATSLERAIVQLGLNLLQSIVFTYAFETKLRNASGPLREHFLRVRHWAAMSSAIASRLAQQAGLSETNTIGTSALLSRLGAAVFGMMQPPPGAEYWKIHSEPARLHHEVKTWGAPCHILSARLFEHWCLPSPLPELVAGSMLPLCAWNEIAERAQVKALLCIAASVVLSGAYLSNHETRAHDLLSREAYGGFTPLLREHEMYAVACDVFMAASTKRELEIIAKQ